MKIGLLIYGSLDTVSGGYLYDRQLVAWLRTCGHQVEILSLPWRSYLRHLTDNLSPELLRRLIEMPIDLLLEDELNHPSLFWLNGKVKREVSYPIISVVHHLRSSEDHPALLMPLYRTIEARYLHSVDGFVYNSHTTERTVQALITHNKPAIVAYPSGSHSSALNSIWLHESITTRQHAQPFRLIFVGNLSERKGLHTVIAGLATIGKVPWHLDVVGSTEVDKEYSAQIRNQLQQTGMAARVTLHGRVSDERLQQLLAQAHLMAMPSYEGFGIVYLEAMAYGLPVIASTAGAAHEIVTPGVNGFLVEPEGSKMLADYVTQLAQDRTVWYKMSMAARQRFDRHPTWQQSFAALESWLLEMTQKSGI
ncbi:MAG: glycosyltransferase family 4 protein [Caldilineaceae bacterium]